MSDTNRRIDNGKSVPDKSVGTLAARNATIGNLVVTGTTTTAGNSAVQFSNMTVTGTLGAGAVNATTSSIGNLTVTGTFVNANATTSQFAAVSVTGNASVGGNVVVGRDGIFCGATSGVTTLATTQYTSNVGLLYTTGTGLNTPANIISTGIITMTNNTSNQFGFVDYTTPTLAPGTPFRIGFDYLYAGAADGFCAQLWFSNNAPTTAIGSNADRSVTNAAIGYRFGYDIFSNKTAGFYQNANVSSGASVSLAKSASALPGNSWCTYTWTFDGASVWTTQVSNAANTAQMYMANVVVDPLALGIWTGATYPNTLRMYGASGGQTALQQIRNVTVSTTTLGNVRGIGCGFVGAANVSTGAYVASSAGTGSAPIVGNTYVSFVGNGTANGGYLDAGPQTFTRFATGATVMAYVAFTAPNVETQRAEAICSFGNGTGANTFRLSRNGNSSTTIMFVSDSVGNTCVAGNGGNIVPYVPSVWTGVFTPPTTCTMYQNATLVNTNTNPGTIMSLAPSTVMPHTYVGKSQFGDPYASMNLYGFVYWNASLTPAQITQAYTYLTAGTGSLPRPEAISAPLTILPTAPNALVGNSAYVQNVIDSSVNSASVTSGIAGPLRVGWVAPSSATPYSTPGRGSLFFNGVYTIGAAPFTVSSLSGFTWSGQDTTMEAWVNMAAYPVYTGQVAQAPGLLFGARDNGNGSTGGPDYSHWGFGVDNNGYLNFEYYNFSINVITTASKVSLNAWHHVAMTYTSSTGAIRMFIDGTQQTLAGSGAAGNTATKQGTPVYGYPFIVGQYDGTTLNGYVTDMRIVNGNVVYAGNFTVPSTPLGNAASGTTVLLTSGVNVTAQNGNVTATNANASSVGVTNSVTIAGNLSVVTDVNARGDVAVSKNAVVTGNVSATNVNATGNLAVTKFATVTGGITLPGNAAAAFGTPGNAAVVLTLGSFANVLSYANTYDTPANIAATGNIVMTANVGGQVQSVSYIVPGLVPGVPFFANVAFTYLTPVRTSEDFFGIQLFSSENGTTPFGTNTSGLTGLTGVGGYMFGYIVGTKVIRTNQTSGIGNQSGIFGPNIVQNSTYNYYIGFDGVQTWTYNISNTTTTITSGTYVDTFSLYNMSQATYPNVVRLRACSNSGMLIMANSVNIVANVGTPYSSSQGVVVKTLGSYANVLSYANTYDTLANIAATGNLILSDNTANQVQSVTYVVPGLAPGVAFSANVGFTFGTSGQAAGNAGGDAYAIQFFPTENGTYPLTTNSINLGVVGIADTRYGYLFAYLFGNNTGGQSKIGIYSFSPSSGSRSALMEYYNPNLQANVAYNFFVGFDGVQTWTYKVSNSTTVIASGTATDPAALYNMSMALYPTTVRIRANSNNGISLITANAVSIVANVGVGYASATANASGFIVADSNNATMMTIKSASPYVATLGSVIANVAATVGPGSLNVFGPTYFGNSTTLTGPTTVSGPSTFSGATTFNAPVTVGYVNSYSNIVPNATSGIVWAGGTPNAMIESYYASTDRYGFGVFGNVMRIYTSSAFGGAVVCLGKYSTTGTTVSTDWVYGNSSGVYMTSNVSVASNVSSSTGNVILAAQTIRVPGVDLGNNSVLALNASGGTQNNMINLWGANPSGTATNVWGFGLASGTLRYNAILTSHIHGFYSNTFTCATIWYSGTAIAGNANSEALTVTNSYGTGFTGNAVTLATTTAAGTGFNMLMATANGVKQFRVAGNGATYANGPYSSAGADYAEYFEWADGNPGAEDRRGLTVVLDGGDKIRIATGTDASNDIIGVVSAVPTTIGDSAWSRWQGMYVTDAFGCATPDLNPAYDPDTEYVPRSERKEWAPVGLVGKLRVLTGRPVGSSWIRMTTDITPGVDLWLVRRPRL